MSARFEVDGQGRLIAWKKANLFDYQRGGEHVRHVLVKLAIPASGVRVVCGVRGVRFESVDAFVLYLKTLADTPVVGKCRAERAEVLDIRTMKGTGKARAYSDYQTYDEGRAAFVGLRYVRGQPAIPNGFEFAAHRECAPGIHFFLTEQEARDYGIDQGV